MNSRRPLNEMTQLLSTWPDSSESRQRMLESSSSTQFNQAYAYPERSKWLTFLGMMRRCKNALILILTPILFSPLVMSEKPESRCGWCVIVMAIYWMTEVMPLAVTAMLPVVLFPLTGVLDCNTTAKEFMNDTNFLFIGGLIMAAAVEKCDLHERVALFVLKMVGGEPKWIMLGFMLVTALLSMFISNTATTAMMVPIGQSVVSQLIASFESHPQNPESGRAGCKSMATGLVMSICFAANIGGTGTATGTPSNLVMLGQLTNLFPKADGSLNYISWIFFAVPLMCICLACAWALLCFFFLRHAPAKDDHVTDMLHSRYDKLPRMSFAEKSVLFCFNLLLILWIFRNPGVVKGFGSLFPKGYYTDATSAMLVAFLLFVLPAEKPNLFEYIRAEDMKKKSCLMDWPTMQRTFPWSVVLLLGGGFALAAGVKESKLSILVGHMLAEYGHLPLWCLQLLTMTIAMAVTNICSNTVTASIFVPIVATLAQQTGNHPFTLMLPVTLGCSFAFVLPVGTPPNAIVFGSGMVKVSNMVTVGLCLSIVTLFLTVAYMNTLALMFLPLNTFPEWAQLDNSTTISAG